MIPRLAIALAVVLVSSAALGDTPDCNHASKVEDFHYSWRLRGGIRFIAGLIFPTSGSGNLRTTFPQEGEHSVHSELLITAPNGKSGGYYAYESKLDDRGAKTLETYHGYSWGNKSRHERTVFDYVKGLARMHKLTSSESENRVKKLPEGSDRFRDILTAIYFLRENAKSFTAPIQTTIYSDGKEYDVVFRPASHRTFEIEGQTTPAIGFEIVDAPGGRKWPGGVKVWLTDDQRRIPVRIEIRQSLASVQLDLQSVEGCTAQMARL